MSKLAQIAYPALALTFMGAFALNKERDFNGRIIANTERKTSKTREATKTLLDANFEAEVLPKPKMSDRPTFVEYVNTSLPRILGNPTAQSTSEVCQLTRAKCALVAEGKIPDPIENPTFFQKFHNPHATDKIKDAIREVLSCEKQMQKCVLNTVLPHRTRKR